MATSEASMMLERAARKRGLTVQRLDGEVVVCGDDRRSVVFHGWCGAGSSKVAHELCGNVPWLRGHVAAHGLPVVPTAWVDRDDVAQALAAAQTLGLPVWLVGVDSDSHCHEGVADDATGFRQLWQRVVGQTRATSAYVQRPYRVVQDLVVVAGEVVAGSGGGEMDRLAVRAVEAVPGLRYAAVRLVTGTAGAAGADVQVDRVDPAMLWPASPSHDAAAVAVADAVLNVEFGALT